MWIYLFNLDPRNNCKPPIRGESSPSVLFAINVLRSLICVISTCSIFYCVYFIYDNWHITYNAIIHHVSSWNQLNTINYSTERYKLLFNVLNNYLWQNIYKYIYFKMTIFKTICACKYIDQIKINIYVYRNGVPETC